jgi:hypothetical protein
MADITESTYGVVSPSGSIWYFDETLPSLVSQGQGAEEDVEFHPLALNNEGGPFSLSPYQHMVFQRHQLALVPGPEGETPQGTVDFALLGDVDFVPYIGPAPAATRADLDSTTGLWSAHAFGTQFNDTLYIEEDGLPSIRTRDVGVDALDQVWVATAQGLVHRRLGRFYPYYPGGEPLEGNPLLKANQIYSVEIDRENRAWFGTEAGLFYFDGIRIRPVYTTEGASLPPVYDLFVDHYGVLWIATAQGLYRRLARSLAEINFNEAPFEAEHLSLIPGFEPSLTRIQGTFDDRIFAASPRGLFLRSADGITRQFTRLDGLPSTRVHDVFVINTYPDPLVWVSTDLGLSRYSSPLRELNAEETHTTITQPYPPFSIDGSGLMWISFEGGYFEEAPSDPTSTPIFLFPFEMTQSEVTRSQWAMLINEAQPPSNLALLPQIANDPQALQALLPDEMDLPTQAEWELTAQGDRLQHHRLYAWGETFPWYEGIQCERVNSQQCGRGLTSVCQLPLGQTEQGLCDLNGNATEWVWSKTEWRLAGGGGESNEIELRLINRVQLDDPTASVRAPETSRGFRLVKRTR